MKSQAFTNEFLIPTVTQLFGAQWEGRVVQRQHQGHVVIEVSGITPESKEHHALQRIGITTHTQRALLGDGTYSFVLER